MFATVTRSSLDYEQLLYQSAVDNEFRTALLDNPAIFAMQLDNWSLPTSVEPQDQASLEQWNEGIVAMASDCASTCSFGPFTIVCDGTTK